MNTNQRSERFNNFAKMECRGSSELYEYLSIGISEDDASKGILCMNTFGVIFDKVKL
ncbi:hypothetical protein [Bacillus cereus group sp. BfR-BA-01380]|uniref:hypothetical protein n=1 Tax=Bacillus cereus group sp. BfR-BA-01380 TaxID=2920324 RepID=UPI001F5A86BD|nr:hypothetical protein [Bacillus cereus group sp. BfR-BA-01380]